MSDTKTLYPVGARVRIGNFQGPDGGYNGITGTVIDGSRGINDAYVRVTLDTDPDPISTALVEVLTGERGFLFAPGELEAIGE